MDDFNVQTWSAVTTYQLNDIVYLLDQNGKIDYYYCLGPNTNFNPRLSPEYWTQDFLWVPSIGNKTDIKFNSISPEIRRNALKMGNKQAINNATFSTNLVFSGKTDSETRAILHFVSTKEGKIPFKINHNIFNGTDLYYVANKITHSHIFFNNNEISFEIQQVNKY